VSKPSITIGIPARFASTRFPGKALTPLQGRPMIAHVIERALSADIGPVIVATDDQRIADAAIQAGAEARLTATHHTSGSERLAEAFASVDCDIVINVQGDEPLISPEAMLAVTQPLLRDAGLQMATLAEPLEASAAEDPNVVKVVLDHRGHALYFSRAIIPYPRQEGVAGYLKHIGLYAYRRAFLLTYPTLAPSEAEQAEQLEQLRALHHGHAIAVTVGPFGTIGVDTPEDLARVAQLLTDR
jgi:3-deoxy-manno-octulosonate cytidylyltransferase (CMP-KDO synthetase)